MITNRLWLVLLSTLLLAETLCAQHWTGTENTTGTINRTGNVGIGITAPLTSLHIKGNGSNGAAISLEKSSASEEAGISFKKAGAYQFFLYSDNADGEGLKIQDATEPDATPRIHVPYGNKNLYLVQSGGNVGIGTANPHKKLHVFGTGDVEQQIEAGDDGYASLTLRSNNKMWHWSKRPSFEGDALNLFYHDGNGWQSPYMSIATNGSIGVGVTSPQAKLHIEGNQWLTGNLQLGAKHDAMGYGTRLDLGSGGNWDDTWLARYNRGEDITELRLNVGDDGGDRFTIGHHHYSDGEWRPAVSVTSAGQMSIGTMSVPAGYKLAVGGNIIAEKIKVQPQSNWADYVFKPTYKLPTLQEVEAFIKQYKHLPDVPSAKEVEKNGLDLGENQVVLLKKIEELTLYAIEADKSNKTLKEQNQEQLELIKKLDARLKELESKQ